MQSGPQRGQQCPRQALPARRALFHVVENHGFLRAEAESNCQQARQNRGHSENGWWWQGLYRTINLFICFILILSKKEIFSHIPSHILMDWARLLGGQKGDPHEKRVTGGDTFFLTG